MRRPNLERFVTAAIFWLLVAGVLLVGTAPASAQSKPNGQGIPQQISALEQQVAALNAQIAALDGRVGLLSAPSSAIADQVAALNQRLTALGQQVSALNVANSALGDQVAALTQQLTALSQQVSALSVANSASGDRLTAFDRRLTALDERVAGLASSSGKVLRVVDANGTEVGPMISKGEVVRKLGDVWHLFSVGPSGFVESGAFFYNTDPECNGAWYMGNSLDLIRQAYVVGTRVYYGEGDPQEVQVAAYKWVSSGDNPCYRLDQPMTASYSRVVFSVLPPFSAPFTVRYDQ